MDLKNFVIVTLGMSIIAPALGGIVRAAIEVRLTGKPRLEPDFLRLSLRSNGIACAIGWIAALGSSRLLGDTLQGWQLISVETLVGIAVYLALYPILYSRQLRKYK